MAIPSNLRVPFMYVEFDSSRAFLGPNLLKYKALIVGEMLTSGSKTANDIHKVTSADQAAQYWGDGSVIHRMFISWFKNNKIVEVYGQGITEGTGAKATLDVTVTGTATAAGTVYFYVAGKQLQVAVAKDDDPTAVADAIVAAITEDSSLPVSASNAAGVITIEAKNEGEIGNDIDLRYNYNDGEELPAGITIEIGAGTDQGSLATGSGTPAGVSSAISNWGDEWYNVIVLSFSDSTNIALVETEMSDRFGPLLQLDGMAFTGVRGTLSDLETYGNNRNSPHLVVVENGSKSGIGSPSTTWEKTAAVSGRVAREAETDPARPFQTLELVGILAPTVSERFTLTERNTLLYDGVAATNVDASGKVRIERVITTYQTNAAGATDIAYLDANTLFTLMFIRFDFRNTILSKYPRAKLANDGVRVAPNQQVMTPSVGKAEAVAKFRQWEALGLVENIDQFKQDLVVERSISDPNRLDWILPPDLVNQLRVNGTTIQFLLESPSI